jgi:Mrp family chromosome partitioning ATPase
MTIFERLPNPIFASQRLSKFLIRQVADQRDPSERSDELSETTDQTDDATAQETEARGTSFGDQSSTRRLTKAIAAADAQSASVIGIVGARRGVGVSVTSRQLAGAFASFGRKTLLVNASRVDFSKRPDDPRSILIPSLSDLATEMRPSLCVVDLADVIGDFTLSPIAFRQALETATQAGQTIVVDLPPIVRKSGLPDTAISALGEACDLVFLVCLNGGMRRKELSECVETCKVVGLKLNGLILNDWRLPASGLLER